MKRVLLQHEPDYLYPDQVYDSGAKIVCYLTGSGKQRNTSNVAFLARTENRWGFVVHNDGPAFKVGSPPAFKVGSPFLYFNGATLTGAIKTAIAAGHEIMCFDNWPEFATWLVSVQPEEDH